MLARHLAQWLAERAPPLLTSLLTSILHSLEQTLFPHPLSSSPGRATALSSQTFLYIGYNYVI